jgi:hypothetical protein
LATSPFSSSLRALKQIGQTNSSPPPSAYYSNSRGSGGHPSHATASAWPGTASLTASLGQPHRHGVASLSRGTPNQERDCYPLGILKAGRQIDEHLARHVAPPRDVPAIRRHGLSISAGSPLRNSAPNDLEERPRELEKPCKRPVQATKLARLLLCAYRWRFRLPCSARLAGPALNLERAAPASTYLVKLDPAAEPDLGFGTTPQRERRRI